jgi:hypothetical protein
MCHPHVVHPYCLRCFSDLGNAAGNAVHCPECGFRNLASDRRTYWNRNPRLMETEQHIQIIGALLAAGCSILISTFHSSGVGAGYLYALPIVLAALVWRSAAKMTRHMPHTHPASTWASFAIAAGIGFGILAGGKHLVLGFAVGVIGTGIGLAIAYSGVLANRWKARLMRRL